MRDAAAADQPSGSIDSRTLGHGVAHARFSLPSIGDCGSLAPSPAMSSSKPHHLKDDSS